MSAPRYTKDMVLVDVFQHNPKTAEVMTGMGYRCADCIVCLKDTVEVAAQLHEKDLHELLQALNGASEPKPEESMGWKLAEKVRKLEQEHFANLEAARTEIDGILSALGPGRSEPSHGKEATQAMEKIWAMLQTLRKSQTAYEKKRTKLLGSELGPAAEEVVQQLVLARSPHPDVLSFLFPGLERRPEELEKWLKMFDAGGTPAATDGPKPDPGTPRA